MNATLASWSYYGCLSKVKIKESLGLYIVDAEFKRIIDRNKAILEAEQMRLLNQFRRSLLTMMRDFKKSVKDINTRLRALEKVKNG